MSRNKTSSDSGSPLTLGALNSFVDGYLNGLQRALSSIDRAALHSVVGALARVHRRKGRIFIMGNGGSAATASHMACDLSKNTRPPTSSDVNFFRVSSLVDNVAILTAWANDHSFDRIFADQLVTEMTADDAVIAISASGNSPNILAGLNAARSLGGLTIGLLGFGGGSAKALVDHALVVDSNDYGAVEDVHMVLNHIIVGWFKNEFASAVLRRSS